MTASSYWPDGHGPVNHLGPRGVFLRDHRPFPQTAERVLGEQERVGRTERDLRLDARGEIVVFVVFVARSLVARDRGSDVKRTPLASRRGVGGARPRPRRCWGSSTNCEEIQVELIGDLQRDGDDHHPVEPDARHGDVEQLADHVVPDRFVPGPKRALPVGTLDQGVDDFRPQIGADRCPADRIAWRSEGPPGGNRPPGARPPRRGSRGTRGGHPACRGVGRSSPDRRESGASCRG